MATSPETSSQLPARVATALVHASKKRHVQTTVCICNPEPMSRKSPNPPPTTLHIHAAHEILTRPQARGAELAAETCRGRRCRPSAASEDVRRLDRRGEVETIKTAD